MVDDVQRNVLLPNRQQRLQRPYRLHVYIRLHVPAVRHNLLVHAQQQEELPTVPHRE